MKIRLYFYQSTKAKPKKDTWLKDLDYLLLD